MLRLKTRVARFEFSKDAVDFASVVGMMIDHVAEIDLEPTAFGRLEQEFRGTVIAVALLPLEHAGVLAHRVDVKAIRGMIIKAPNQTFVREETRFSDKRCFASRTPSSRISN